jgi:hypothetical protein
MLVGLQSFIVGMIMAAVILGLGVFLYNALAGDDEAGFGTLPTSTPGTATAPALASGTRTALTPIPGASTTPGTTTPTALTTGTPAATGTPPSGLTALGDRTSCDQIRGTEYRSETERTWFNANCQATSTPSFPGDASGSASGGGSTAPTAPTATPRPPRPPFVNAFIGFIDDYDATAANLSELIADPEFDDNWRGDAGAEAIELQSTGRVITTLSPPSCLNPAYAALLVALQELQFASSVTITGITNLDVNILRLADQRITAGRAQLAQASQLADSASC